MISNKNIPYSRQSIDSKDIDSVLKILKQDIITQGNEHIKFEQSLSKKVNVKNAITFNSATSALHAACFALEVNKDSIVWTATNSFVASANCALYCGAKIDFVDINNNNWNMDIDKLELKLLSAKKKNIVPDVIITVHLGGLPTNQRKIKILSKKYGFKIIEDASHSLGASYQREKVGNCKWSDITVFSFHPVKIITTGEGGMATTNNRNIMRKLKLFRSHGITKEKKYFKSFETPSWQYEQHLLGFNYRMSDIAAALGNSQLKKLDGFIKKRNHLTKVYYNLLKDLPITFQEVPKDTTSSFHLFIIRILNSKKKKNLRDKLFLYLRSKNIYVNLHYPPIHLQPYYKSLGFNKGMFPESEAYSKEAISLPLHVDLSKKDQLKVINHLYKFFNEN